MQNAILYFLKISGTINNSKQREFQQTVQFIFNHLPSECLSHNLTLDVNISNLYHFYSLWQSEEALAEFKFSKEFDLLSGAFQTLGTPHETLSGKGANAQLFEFNLLDT
jgi:hypothetical protein